MSRRLYEGLPEDEKKFWNSHAFEVKVGAGHVRPGPPTRRGACSQHLACSCS
jgi:hypothetical protein